MYKYAILNVAVAAVHPDTKVTLGGGTPMPVQGPGEDTVDSVSKVRAARPSGTTASSLKVTVSRPAGLSLAHVLELREVQVCWAP